MDCTQRASALAAAYEAALRDSDTDTVLTLRETLAAVTAATSEADRETARALLARSITWFDDPGTLPATPGVYVITADAGLTGDPDGDSSAYVGLAKNLHFRFHAPAFGHLSANNATRSRKVLEHPAARIGVVATFDGLDDTGLNQALSEAEVFWFVVLRTAGIVTTNQVANLGRVGDGDHDELPLVACRLTDGKVRVFRSQAEAQRVLGLPSGRIAPVVCGWQAQNGGYTFRPATALEMTLTAKGWVAPTRLDGPTRFDEHRGRRRWSAGPLPDTERHRLARRRKGAYCTDDRSGYPGVSRHPDGSSWVARYVWDPRRRASTRFVPGKHATAEAAAEARDAFLDAHPEYAAINRRSLGTA